MRARIILDCMLIFVLVIGIRIDAEAAEQRWQVYMYDSDSPSWGVQMSVYWGTEAGALDGYDQFDRTTSMPFGFYHESGQDWIGPTGFYVTDYRAPLGEGETKVWTDLYLWYPINFVPTVRHFKLETLTGLPNGWVGTLYLDQVIVGVNYNGPWLWDIMPNTASSTLLTLPIAPSLDAQCGYRFHFVVEPIPEPSTLLSLAGAALAFGALWRRRRWK